MTLVAALVVIAIAQGVLLVATVVLLVAHRLRQGRRTARLRSVGDRVSLELQRWTMGMGAAGEVVALLRSLAPNDALREVTALTSLRVNTAQRDELAVLLRQEPWVQGLLAHVDSRFWWRRLDAARILSVVGTPEDRALLAKLLDDDHTDVQTVATMSLARVGDVALIARAIEQLPPRPSAVRLFRFGALKQVWPITAPILLEHLRSPDTTPAQLEAWVSLAESIGTPECLRAVLELREHPAPAVRLVVARALKAYFHPDALPVLLTLLADEDWRVRGQAARALGAIRATTAIPALVAALADRAWWVRFRSGLALAQLGDPGRSALRAARSGPDRYGRDMASMVCGLSDGCVVELAEA